MKLRDLILAVIASASVCLWCVEARLRRPSVSRTNPSVAGVTNFWAPEVADYTRGANDALWKFMMLDLEWSLAGKVANNGEKAKEVCRRMRIEFDPRGTERTNP